MLKLIEEEYKENPIKVLRKKKVKREIYEKVSDITEKVANIKNLRVLDIPETAIYYMTEIMRIHGLLPRDSLHVSIMRVYGVRNIASGDEDFDQIKSITRWTPI